MNITEIVDLTLSIGLYINNKSLNLLNLIKSDIFWGADLSDQLLCIFISNSNIITLLVLKFFLSFLGLVVIVVLISFYKSLQTKYRFARNSKENRNARTKHDDNPIPLRRLNFDINSFTRVFIENWIISYRKSRDECDGALSEIDSLKVIENLPWSETRPNIETLDWLNVTIESFWPSIKHSLDIFIFKDLHRIEIDLGLSAPRISGIEFVKGNSSSYSCGNLLGTADSNITEKDKNISLALEVSYQTDEKFRITGNSVPLLGSLSLTKLNIQSRFLLTLNHPACKLNKDLKIFETPDDILWPLVDYFQVALVDVPKIDWRFKRATGNYVDGKEKHWWSVHLDVERVLNHSYFKYLVHSSLCLILRWFKPFDPSWGKRIYWLYVGNVADLLAANKKPMIE